MKKKIDYSKKAPAELQTMISEHRKDLLDARFAFAGARTKNVHEQKGKRKAVARMLTRLGQLKAEQK